MVVVCFLRNASCFLLVGLVHTGIQCVPTFLLARLYFSDSTHALTRNSSLGTTYIPGNVLADVSTSTPPFAVRPDVSDAPSHAFTGCGQCAPPHFFSVSFAVFVSLRFPTFQLAPRIFAFLAFWIRHSGPPALLFPFDSVQ